LGGLPQCWATAHQTLAALGFRPAGVHHSAILAGAIRWRPNLFSSMSGTA